VAESRQYFGGYVRSHRERLELTQDDVARQLDKTQSWISKVERANHPAYLPPLSALRGLSDILHVPLGTLVLAGYGLADSAQGDVLGDDPEATFEQITVIVRSSSLDPSLQQALLGCVEWVRGLLNLGQDSTDRAPGR